MFSIRFFSAAKVNASTINIECTASVNFSFNFLSIEGYRRTCVISFNREGSASDFNHRVVIESKVCAAIARNRNTLAARDFNCFIARSCVSRKHVNCSYNLHGLSHGFDVSELRFSSVKVEFIVALVKLTRRKRKVKVRALLVNHVSLIRSEATKHFILAGIYCEFNSLT